MADTPSSLSSDIEAAEAYDCAKWTAERQEAIAHLAENLRGICAGRPIEAL